MTPPIVERLDWLARAKGRQTCREAADTIETLYEALKLAQAYIDDPIACDGINAVLAKIEGGEA